MNKFEQLNNIPDYILSKLKDMINTKESYIALEKQLKISPIHIEKDDYQVMLLSVEDLVDLKIELNKKEYIQ